ncbi:hypothetical protein [Desulfosporosinus fructosivorans]
MEDAKIDPFERIVILEERIKENDAAIKRMQVRDVDIEKLKNEVKKLNEDIAQNIQAYNTLDETNLRLSLEIAELKGLKTKVVKMSRRSKNQE